MLKPALFTLALIFGLAGCAHPGRVAPTPCGPTSQLQLTIRSGPNPTFTWTPACAIGWVQVARSDADQVAWQIEARDSVNAFTSPMVFGVVPSGAIELTPAIPLVSGATYTVTLGRFFDGNFGGQPRRVIIQMAQETFRP